MATFCPLLSSLILLIRAMRCSRRGDHERAIVLMDRAVQLVPDEPTLYRARAWTLKRLGKPILALADYNEAVRLCPLYGPAFLDRGLLLMSEGHNEEAISDLTQAISLDSKLIKAFYHRASAKHSLGQFQAALDDYTHSLVLRPKDDFALLGRANCWLSLGRPQQAISDLNVAITLNPDWPDSYVSRGAAHFELDHLDLALSDLTEGIRRQSRWLASAFIYRAHVQLKKGEDDLALDDYTEALAQEPENVEFLVGRSSVWLQKGDSDRARADCERALVFSPEYALAHHNLGWSLINLRKYQEALAHFEKALALDPKNLVSVESIALLLLSCPNADVRDPDRAMKYAEELKASEGVSDSRWLRLMAAASAEAGKFAEAVTLQTAAIQCALKPDSSDKAALDAFLKQERWHVLPKTEVIWSTSGDECIMRDGERKKRR